MSLRYVASCGVICAALLFAGCDDGRRAPGRVAIQVANAAPGFATLQFQRERDSRQGCCPELAFKNATIFDFDADTYDFNVHEPTRELDNPGRSWTFAVTLEENTGYTFVLTEVAGEVEPVVIQMPEAPADNGQIVALNAASDLPAMDLYLQPTGVGIAGAAPRGTFGAHQQITPFTLAAGDYELFLTSAGNPADVLLTSQSFAVPAGINSTIVVVDEKGLGTAQVNAILLQGANTTLFDRDAPAELTVINGATDQVARDVAVSGQFSPPLFSAVPYLEPTAYAEVPVGTVQVNITPVGNPGVFELETSFSAVIGQRATMLFAGPAGTLSALFAADDGRRMNREAKLRFMNAASQFEFIDYVITKPGVNPDSVPTATQLSRPGISAFLPLPPGDFDLYVYQGNTATLLSGPTPINLAAGGIYGVVTIDGPDTATVDLRFLYDFP